MRRRAYLAAGRIGGPGAAELVRPGLRDSVAAVRAAAAFGLGLLRDTASVDSLAQVALRASAGDAVNAVFALGRIGSPSAHATVAAVLGLGRGAVGGGPILIGSPDRSVLGAALLTLWRFKRDPHDAQIAQTFAASPDTALRWRAAYALMRMGDPTTVPTLLRLLRDPYAEVRALAARGLRASVADSAGQRAAARAALLAALADSAAHVRINAVTALAGYRAPEAIGAMARLLDDPDANVQVAAAGALAAGAAPGLASAAALTPLSALVADAARPLALRAAALAALVRLDPRSGVAAARLWAAAATEGPAAVGLPQAAGTPQAIAAAAAAPVSIAVESSNGGRHVIPPAPPLWRTRFYAASALGAGRWADVSDALLALARDPDPRVASQALSSMTELLGDTVAPPRALLLEKLADPDPIVRASAIAALGAHPTPADLSLFLDSYARAAADTANDAALAAVDALAALQKAGAPAATSFFTRFQRSTDPVVRRSVAGKLGAGWGAVAPIETGRDSAFYLDTVRRLVAPVLAGAPAPRVVLRTALAGTSSVGEVVLELDPVEAPLTVDNFLRLAAAHYFDGDRWHRVVPNFVVQDGDPRGDGNGGPGWQIRDELNPLAYLRGALGMALSGPDTGGSQFFLTLSPQPHLDAGYTLFGHVVAGWDVVDRVLQDDLIRSIEVSP